MLSRLASLSLNELLCLEKTQQIAACGEARYCPAALLRCNFYNHLEIPNLPLCRAHLHAAGASTPMHPWCLGRALGVERAALCAVPTEQCKEGGACHLLVWKSV